MNLILAAPHEVGPGGEVFLSDRRAAHIREVLRPALGQALAMGIVGGPMGKAVVTALGEDGVALLFVGEGEARPPLPIHLVVAMPRPKVVTRVVEAAGTFGVAALTLINSWRVDKSYLASPSIGEAALHEALIRGAEQGKTTHLPRVCVYPRFMEFIDSIRAPVRWVCHPGGASTFKSLMSAASTTSAITPSTPAMIVIGPEGGFIERELETFARAGFCQVGLSAATLRSEQAVHAALAQFELCLR